MKKEATLIVCRSFWRTGLFAAVTSLFLLGACEANKPADQEAKARDRAAAAAKSTKDATQDSTVTTQTTTN